MQFHITKAASKQLHKLREDERAGYLKLVFDAEGCGCSLEGVPALWLIQNLEPKDVIAELTKESESSPWPLVYEQRHEVFFEEQLTLDYKPQHNSFVLKSNNQIYSNRMIIADQRSAQL